MGPAPKGAAEEAGLDSGLSAVWVTEGENPTDPGAWPGSTQSGEGEGSPRDPGTVEHSKKAPQVVHMLGAVGSSPAQICSCLPEPCPSPTKALGPSLREGGKEGGKEPEKPRFLREGGEKRERGVGQTGPGTDRGGGEREKVSKM